MQLTHEAGRTVGEVAAGLGVDRGLLQRWRSGSKRDGGEAYPGRGRPKASEEELLRLKKELARTQQEHDIKKSAGLLRESAELRFAFIEVHWVAFDVGLMCSTLEVSRSGYYAWLVRGESAHTREDRRLLSMIRE